MNFYAFYLVLSNKIGTFAPVKEILSTKQIPRYVY